VHDYDGMTRMLLDAGFAPADRARFNMRLKIIDRDHVKYVSVFFGHHSSFFSHRFRAAASRGSSQGDDG
jgi:hypothetical protein